jgi:diguanylate cyclase (GGDEF)-like protein
MSAWNPASERQVSNTFLIALLSYLERAGGDELVRKVLAAAGCDKPRPDLMGATWGARDEVLALAEVGAALTGDRDIGRRVGEEMFRMNTGDPATTAFFVSLGSPAAALEGVLEHTVKLGRGRSYRMVSSDDSGCVIRGDYGSAGVGDPFFCGLSLGYWPMLAGLFRAVGTSTHPTCQCRGDEYCTFVIRWDRGAEADRSEVAAADAEVRQRLGTFEEMQLVAEELARAADLPALAEKILDSVDTITPAPQLLVAIRSQDDKPPVVAWRGMTARTARPLATALLCGSDSGRVPITAMAPLGPFGVVAAIAPDARAPSETSSRLLEAFARHAGARIEAVISRQLAEESRQTANALLLLARSLSETTTEKEVSECVASAIPKLVGADHAAVLRWNAETHRLRTVAHAGLGAVTPREEFPVDEVPALCEVAAGPGPVVIDRSTAHGYIRRVMDEIGERINIVVPLVEQGDFLGFVCAGYRGAMGLDRDAACARLQGTADLAATAFTKARLLEEIRHQALHDDLTGLPNRALLEDRVDQALREAKRNDTGLAVLFLDLDRFKRINDSMGHDIGDILIQAATGRIRQALRERDVFARMGGDEFVIGLPGVKDAADGTKVADKILADLREPFDIGGQSLYISASIGLAVYPDDGEDYGSLLQAADKSMYAAKDSGRNTVRRRPSGDGRAESQKPLARETELPRAIEGDGLEVEYQPQVAMVDLTMTGVEA